MKGVSRKSIGSFFFFKEGFKKKRGRSLEEEEGKKLFLKGWVAKQEKKTYFRKKADCGFGGYKKL